jgi:single-stranded DNA-specific DHH superfamily exonuclease
VLFKSGILINKMRFLRGNKKEFEDFLNSIKPEDNIAILSHDDLDGACSAIFLEEILKNQKKEARVVEFLELKKGLFGELHTKLEGEKITKILISDIAADEVDADEFAELIRRYDVLLIDHHPENPKFKNEKNIIKADSLDCAGLMLYELGEGMFEREKWNWLMCATIVADFSYKKPENLKFVQRLYPEVTLENIRKVGPGKIAEKIGYASIYFNFNAKKIYKMIKNKDMEELEEHHNEVKKEMDRIKKEFKEKAEFYKEKKLYIYYFESKFPVVSLISSEISLEDPDKGFILMTEDFNDANFIKISARNQSGEQNMNLLLKKGIKGLEESSGGGHPQASGGRIRKKDVEKFNQNILQ